MWKPGTTAEDRRRHHADLQAWADEIRASLPLAERQLLNEHAFSSGRGSADCGHKRSQRGRQLARQVAHHQCDHEPLIDFEHDPRLSEDDCADMRSLAEKGRRRWLNRYGSNW